MPTTTPKYVGGAGVATIRDWFLDQLTVQVEDPAFTYSEDTGMATMTCATPEASIHYTTDGSEPTEQNSEVYSSPIAITRKTSFKIKAFKAGMIASATIEATATPPYRIWAVRWDYGNSSPALTRLSVSSDPLSLVTQDVATEPKPQLVSSGQAGSSPFDGDDFWDGIRRRNFNTSGVPDAWDGEDGFSTTTKDTMVWIPEFWVKVVDNPSSSIRDYYLSTGEAEGFVKHPGSGQYVGAYPTSNNNQSMSGKTRQSNQSIVTMRTNAKAKGAGWGLIDWAERTAIQFLYIIEYANWNSQEMIGEGPTSDYATGQSDALTYHTGSASNGVVRYRWIEGLWRSQFEWTDGLNVVGGQVYVSTDRDNYQSDVTTGYTLISGCAGNNHNIQKLKYDAGHPWSIGLPEVTGGSAYDQYIGDDGLISNGTYVLYCGGSWDSYASYGLFRFGANRSSSYSRSYYGSRLSYRTPPVATPEITVV